MTRDQAHAAATELLQRAYAHEPVAMAVQPQLTEERGWAWAVQFDSEEYLRPGDETRRPISRLIVVPKDGSPAEFMPTAYTWPESQEFLDTGRRPAPRSRWGAR